MRRVSECRHCERRIVTDDDGRWVDPEATGDDVMWRETCDAHDTFTAEHEPTSTMDTHAAKPEPRKFKCRRCGVPCGYWYHGWKHQNGGGGKPSCGQKPDPIEVRNP